jgi:hypothetical protein
MLMRYRKVILFNKNLLLSGSVSFLAGALTTGYCVYIPLFAFLFYRDNKSRYIDPLTKKKNFKNIREDVMKLFGTFTMYEVVFIVTK